MNMKGLEMALSPDARRYLTEQDQAPTPLAPIERATHSDPDKVTENLRLSESTGLPYAIIQDNEQEAKRLDRLRIINAWDLPKRSPATAKWLINDRNASQSVDDIANLEEMEAANRKRSWLARTLDPTGFGDSAMIGLGKFWDQLAMGFLSDDSTEMSDELWEKMGLKKGDTPEVIEQNRLQREQDKLKRDEAIEQHKLNIEAADIEIARLTPKDLTSTGHGFRGAGQMIFDAAGALGISAATRGKVNPLMGMLVSKAVAEAYGKSRVEGRPHEEAKGYAVLQGAVEYFTEKGPTGLASKMFAELGGKGSNLKKDIAKFMVGDLVGEQLATAGNTIIDVGYGLDEELANAGSFEEQVNIQIERHYITAVATLFGSGGISGSAYLADRSLNRGARRDRALIKHIEKKLNSEASQDWLDNQIFLSQSSKVNERASEVFKDYLEKLDPGNQVFLSAEIAGQIIDPPSYVTNQLDGTGADVSIALSDFLTDIVNNEETLTLVRPHVRVQADFLTQNEIETNVDTEQVKKLIDNAQKNQEALTEAQVIFEKVKDQLVQTGRQGEHTARLSAEIIPAYVVAKQAELKARGIERTIQQLYEDQHLRVEGPKGKPPSKEDTLIMEQANALEMVVGGRTADGEVFSGEKGQMHFQLRDQHPDRFDDFLAEPPEMGFVDKKGNFLTREEAFEVVRKETPIIGGDAAYGLESEDLPAVRAQQKLGDITLEQTGTDEAGNKVVVKEKAQSLWNHQQKRIKMIENLRACVNA
jgi:hypothetical protein